MPIISPSSIQNLFLKVPSCQSAERASPGPAAGAVAGQAGLAPTGRPPRLCLFPGSWDGVHRPPAAGRHTIEVGTVGKEGVLPGAPPPGGEVATSEAMVQLEGTALRMPAEALRHSLDANKVLRRHFARYAHSFHQHVARTAACSGAHSLQQRFARWLLLARHRIGSDELPLTQEFLSMMLAVRRAGVTTAAGALQHAGLIRYRHGRITVLDPAGLEE